ncbi:apolipoprotein O, a [Symphorus nematophorus]
MLKVTGSAMPAGALGLVPFTVSAAAGGDGDKEPSTAPLLRDELSLYAAPQQHTARYVEPEAGQLEETVATLRKFVTPYTDWCQDTYSKIKPKVQSVVRFGNDTYAYLKDPPKDFYPRAGVIGFTGVLGLFLARGSRIKRLIYPAGLMTVSASLYYPEQAAAIAKSTGDSVYDRAVRGYAAVERILNPPSKPEKDPETKP